MNRSILAVALAGSLSLVPFAPASGATRHYDCSKPGIAAKAACKSAAADASRAAAKSAPQAKPSETKVSSTTSTKTVTQRNYDCSKASNRNKAVCKAAATPAKPVMKQTSVATATRHFDCTKPGNANRAQCSVSAATHQTASKPVASSRPAATPAARPSPALQAVPTIEIGLALQLSARMAPIAIRKTIAEPARTTEALRSGYEPCK